MVCFTVHSQHQACLQGATFHQRPNSRVLFVQYIYINLYRQSWRKKKFFPIRKRNILPNPLFHFIHFSDDGNGDDDENENIYPVTFPVICK